MQCRIAAAAIGTAMRANTAANINTAALRTQSSQPPAVPLQQTPAEHQRQAEHTGLNALAAAAAAAASGAEGLVSPQSLGNTTSKVCKAVPQHLIS